MNEEQEALWVLIHARVCYALATKNEMLNLKLQELLLLREQMPNLLSVNK